MDSKYTNKTNGQNTVDANSPHGLDLVFEDPSTGYIVVVESKSFTNGAFNLNSASATLSPQMSDDYIIEQTARMFETDDAKLINTAQMILDARDTGVLKKIVSGVDKEVGSFVMVPLD